MTIPSAIARQSTSSPDAACRVLAPWAVSPASTRAKDDEKPTSDVTSPASTALVV